MRTISIALGLLISLVLAGTWVGAEVWDATREGTTSTSTGAITNATDASLIDDHARADRQEVRYRAEVEHCFGDDTSGCFASGGGGSQTSDHGRHREGSARAFMQSSTPSALVQPDYDNTARTRADGVTTLDDGRLFVDNDSNRGYVYDLNDTAFETIQAGDVMPGATNLLYNGSFEATDGGGNDSSTTVPAGWTAIATTTFAYNDSSSDGEGSGLLLSFTAAANNDGVEQALTGLKPSQTYKALCRVKDDATNDCSLQVDAKGGTNLSAQTTSTDDWETLGGVFTTDASADADLEVFADTSGGVCGVDYCAVYEIDQTATRNELPRPGFMAFRDTGNDDGTACSATYNPAGACGNLAAVLVEPPGPGYIAQINAWAREECGSNQEAVIRVFEDTGNAELIEIGGDSTTSTGKVPLRVSYLYTTPLTAGTVYDFQVDIREATGDACSTDDDATGAAEVFAEPHGIEVLLIPTGN